MIAIRKGTCNEEITQINTLRNNNNNNLRRGLHILV